MCFSRLAKTDAPLKAIHEGREVSGAPLLSLVSSHGQLGMGADSWLSGTGVVELLTTVGQWCWCLALSTA